MKEHYLAQPQEKQNPELAARYRTLLEEHNKRHHKPKPKSLGERIEEAVFGTKEHQEQVFKQHDEQQAKHDAARKERTEKFHAEQAEKKVASEEAQKNATEEGAKNRRLVTYTEHPTIQVNLNDAKHQEQLHPKAIAVQQAQHKLMLSLSQMHNNTRGVVVAQEQNQTKASQLMNEVVAYAEALNEHGTALAADTIIGLGAVGIIYELFGALTASFGAAAAGTAVAVRNGAPPTATRVWGADEMALGHRMLNNPNMKNQPVVPMLEQVGIATGKVGTAIRDRIASPGSAIITGAQQFATGVSKGSTSDTQLPIVDNANPSNTLNPSVTAEFEKKAQALPSIRSELDEGARTLHKIVEDARGNVDVIAAQLDHLVQSTSANARHHAKDMNAIPAEIEEFGLETTRHKMQKEFLDNARKEFKYRFGFELPESMTGQEVQSFIQNALNARFGDAALNLRNMLVHGTEKYLLDGAQNARLKTLDPSLLSKVIADIVDQTHVKMGGRFAGAQQLFQTHLAWRQALRSVAEEAVRDPQKASAMFAHFRRSFGVTSDQVAKRPRSIEPNMSIGSGTGAEQLMFRPAPAPGADSIPGERRKKKKRKLIQPAALAEFKKLKSERVNYLEKVIAGQAPLLQQRAGFP